MSFATVVGDRQLAYITKILAIFGVVEERQMRELFSYLPAAKYGRIMTRLSSEGLVYRTSDAKYLSTSRYSLEMVSIATEYPSFTAETMSSRSFFRAKT